MILQIPAGAELPDLAEKMDQAIRTTVFLPLLIWIILVIVFLWLLVKKYPLGIYSRKSNLENPYKLETMGIPRGVIRGILALTVLVAVVLFQIYALRFLESDEKISSFISAFEIVLGFYFGAKVVHHITASDKNKIKAVAGSKGEEKDEFYDPEATG